MRFLTSLHWFVNSVVYGITSRRNRYIGPPKLKSWLRHCSQDNDSASYHTQTGSRNHSHDNDSHRTQIRDQGTTHKTTTQGTTREATTQHHTDTVNANLPLDAEYEVVTDYPKTERTSVSGEAKGRTKRGVPHENLVRCSEKTKTSPAGYN